MAAYPSGMSMEAIAPLVRPESVPFHLLLLTFRVEEVRKDGGQGQDGTLASEGVRCADGAGRWGADLGVDTPPS